MTRLSSFVKKRFDSFLKNVIRVDNRPIDAWTCGDLEVIKQGWFNDEKGELLPGFPITAKDTVVDVGCGDGNVSVFAVRQGANVVATDIDPQQIAFVEKKMARIPQKKGSFRGVVSDSNPLPFADGTATKIVCMEVMEHVDDPAQFLAELVRIGKPGASYLLSVPDPVAESIQRVVAPPAYFTKPNHVRIFQREEFDRVIKNAGLQIEQRTHVGFFWSLWWVLFWASDHGLEDPQGPILENWTKTWYALMNSPKGDATRKALDDFMPKSQIVMARKAA